MQGITLHFPGASVYLLNYVAGINAGNVSQYLTAENKVADTAEDGSYAFEAEWGNYYLVVVADGYRTALQTVEITSANENSFSCEPISLVAGGEDETGSVDLTFVDAATGSVIDYAVALEIREGANNVSGKVLKEIAVDASENGKCTIEELPIGTYTIQVVSADAKSEIVAAPFSVTVVSGQTVTKTFSVTRIINDDQIRFVLRWGDEESDAPSDLDSHLVGPKASGNGKFHTYYSDKTYGDTDTQENYVTYADLDVDDTDWEGPETTTIYKQTAGTYSFYIYDFTDQSDEESTNMSNKSGAIVTVYRGSTLLNTFSVPTGQAGNLWHVCDYDSVTGRVTGINTVGYWPNGGSDTVGMSETDVLKAELDRKISEVSKQKAALVDNAFKADLDILLSEAKSVNSTSDNIDDIKAMIQKLNDIIDAIDSVSNVENVIIDGEYADYEKVYNDEEDCDGILIRGKGENIGNLEITFANENGEKADVQVADVSGQDYVKMVTATNAKYGISRVWKIFYEMDLREIFSLNEDDIVGSMITRVDIETYDTSGWMAIYGVSESLPEFTVNTAEGIEYTISEDDGSHECDVVITLTSGEKTFKYYVEYERDFKLVRPDRISGKGIVSYSVSNINNIISVTGTEATLTDLSVTNDDENKSVQINKDEQGVVKEIVVTNSKYNITVTYSVKYTMLEASAIECDTEYEVSLEEGEYADYTFVPEKTGWYNIKNITSDYSDVYIELYKNGIRVDYSSDGFVEDAYLLAGETYYCRIRQFENENGVYTFTFKVIFAGDDVDMLSLPESDGFTDEAVVADTEGTAFGDESFVEEGESTPEADGFTAGSGDFTENAGESIEADADDFASEDFQ